jgi:hypothetical protein
MFSFQSEELAVVSAHVLYALYISIVFIEINSTLDQFRSSMKGNKSYRNTSLQLIFLLPLPVYL